MLIYKITNLINNKVYIGLTTLMLSQRWKKHLQDCKNCSRPLYKAMRKYGLDNFKIEQIDTTDDFTKLGELERKYIKEYNSTNQEFGYNITAGGESNQLDVNPRAKLKVDDVIQIRRIYSMNELRCSDCWKLYKDKISFSAFQKIWEGTTWQSIMPEVYTKENILFHTNQKGNGGEKNPIAKYTNKEIMEARLYYVNHTLKETFEEYGYNSKSIDSFRRSLTSGYLQIPLYSKIHKKWFLNNIEIDIENYNPVSTISESGE